MLRGSSQLRIRNQVLISNNPQQERHHGGSKRRSQPSKPNLFRGSSDRHGGRFHLLRQDQLALFQKCRSSAHVERAIRALEKVLLKLVSIPRIEFVEEIPFRYLL